MQNTLARRIGRLPIKQRMLAGFGLMLVLLVLIAAQTLTSVLAIRSSAASVVSEYQPAVMIAKTLNEEVNGALASLALFLLNKDEENRSMYLDKIEGIEIILQQLRLQNPIQNSKESRDLLDRIESEVNRAFRGYEERMFDLSQNWQSNFPGMGHSAKTLNPASQVMLQNINTMIQSELDEAPRQALVQQFNELRYSWARIMSSVRAFLAFRNQESKLELETQSERFNDIVSKIKQQYGDSLLFEQEDAIDKIEASYAEFTMDWRKTVELHSGDQWRQDAWLIRSEMAPILKTLFSDINQLTNIQVDKIEKENTLLIGKSNTTAIVVTTLLLIAMLAIAALAYMLNKKIINPIQQAVTEGISSIRHVMKAHSADNHVISSTNDGSGDSIDNVGKTFRIMTTTLQQVLDDQEQAHDDLEGKVMMILDVVRLAAKGDLTGEMMIFSGKSEVDELATGVQAMLDNLNSLSRKVHKSVEQVSKNVATISTTARSQEAAVEQQAENTNEIMATISQIASTSRELAHTMKEVSEASYDNAQGAEKGQAALLRMEDVMKKMRDSTVSVTDSLETLSMKADKISGVVTTIIKIANQTNLLSLNAAIEAEKAGDYGKGFTVVSSEIRRLADQTAVAIWDIEKMVSEMQNAVSKSTDNMRRFSGEINVGADEVAQVSHVLGDIIEQVQILTPRFENVMDGMNTQHQSSEQIRERMRELNTIAQNTAKSLHQYGASVQQLNRAANELQGEFSMLKLTNENS